MRSVIQICGRRSVRSAGRDRRSGRSGGAPRSGIVMVERKNRPHGWALPGGFVDVGERVEAAAKREAREETGLRVTGLRLLGVYSDPKRDPRGHTVSAVFAGNAAGLPRGADDAKRALVFDPRRLPRRICFDHRLIIRDWLKTSSDGWRALAR